MNTGFNNQNRNLFFLRPLISKKPDNGQPLSGLKNPVSSAYIFALSASLILRSSSSANSGLSASSFFTESRP